MSTTEAHKEAKKILFISRQPPYGRSTAKECLDALLAASVFEQDISLLFLGDGVFQLKNQQKTEAVNQKNIANILPVLAMYDIEKVYVQESALLERGLTHSDLAIPVQNLSAADIGTLMEAQDHTLSF